MGTEVEDPAGHVARAAAIADEVLFPRVVETDASEVVPSASLDALAEAGLYGMFGPRSAGGLDLAPEQALAVVEELARGCLATAFVWLQHHSTVRALATGTSELTAQMLPRLCSGELRAGVAFAGLRRPPPPLLRAEEVDEGYVFEGEIPWLTGWGLVDLVLVAAREASRPEGDVVWALVDAEDSAAFSVERLPLAVMDATSTFTAEMRAYRVPAERVVATERFDDWLARDAASLRTNGSMALGLARRAVSLLAERGHGALASELSGAVDSARRSLDLASVAELPAARALAADVAYGAAGALVAARGGRAIVRGEVEEVLSRQAIFLLVFGQTAPIKLEQLRAVEHWARDVGERAPRS